MKDLQSIGVTKKQEALFLKVKQAIGNYPDLEQDLTNNPDKIYIACKRSERFTDSELKFLEEAFMPSSTKGILRKIKELLGL